MGTQKIDGSKLEIFGMVIASFQVDDKNKKFCFILQEIFLLAIIDMDVSFGISFLILSNVRVNFKNWEPR